MGLVVEKPRTGNDEIASRAGPSDFTGYCTVLTTVCGKHPIIRNGTVYQDFDAVSGNR